LSEVDRLMKNTPVAVWQLKQSLLMHGNLPSLRATDIPNSCNFN